MLRPNLILRWLLVVILAAHLRTPALGQQGLIGPADSFIFPSTSPYITPASTSDAPPVASTPEPVRARTDVLDFNPWIAPRPDHYVEADFLLWWAGHSNLPPLLTLNPSGTSLSDAGLTSAASTTTLLGEQRIAEWAHPGIRLRAGRYFRDRRFSRFELDFWHLFQGTETFATQSTSGSPILGRPFTNTASGQPDSQLISFPGMADGSFNSKYTRQAIGVDPLFFFCLKSEQCRWWEFYTGYRFLWLHDAFTLRERTELTPGGFIAPGTRFGIEDSFEASNALHLLPIGLSWSGNRGKWIWNVRGDIGFGINRQMVEVHGRTQAYTNSTLTSSYDAGLLALGTNSGRHRRTQFAWVPQLAFSLQRQLGESTSLQLGYTLININNAVIAAEHIPTAIDPGNLPPAVAGAGPDPRFAFHDDSLWIHGLNFGLRYEY